MFKKILLIFISVFILLSCSAEVVSPDKNDSGNSSPVNPPVIVPQPILDAEAMKYGIDISQDDNTIKQQIEIKLKEYNKDKGEYRVIFIGKPKDNYSYLNSLAALTLEASKNLYARKIIIDISKTYFYDRSIKYKMFEGRNAGNYAKLNFIFPENSIRIIESTAFIRMYSNLDEIAIPDSVITIGDYAFQQADGLKKITFGSKLENIGEGAFSYSELLELVLPESLVSIGEGAFSGSYKLKKITIPASLKSIGDNAFASCSELTTVVYNGTSPDTLKNNTALLYCDNLTTLIIPNAVDEKDPKWKTFLGGKFNNIRKN